MYNSSLGLEMVHSPVLFVSLRTADKVIICSKDHKRQELSQKTIKTRVDDRKATSVSCLSRGNLNMTYSVDTIKKMLPKVKIRI